MGLTRIRAEQISDIDYKQSVRVIALENATLTGGAPAVVDGVSLVAGDRVLVAGQTAAAENGLYQVQTVGAGSNGTWTRTSDANEDGEIQPGMIVMVTQGTEYADTPWKLVTNGVIEIGVTELVFEENYSLAFGNVFVSGTAVIANAVSAPITFVAGTNISITGNNITKTVTFNASGGGGGSGSAIVNGDSNVNIATANADITMGVNGTANVVVVSSDGITVAGNVLPSANVSFDLGTDTQRWRDIYLANSTIYLGNAEISANATSLILTNPEGAQTVFSGSTSNFAADTVTATGNITGGNLVTAGVISATGNITGGNLAGTSVVGTLTTAAQTNITSVGTLTALTVTGNATGGNLITAGLVSLSSITKTGSNGVGNIGAAASSFNTVFAKATSAQYADLAERYLADQPYTPGTVVEIAGSAEVTETTAWASTRIAGVVSTDPAFIMNSGAQGEHVVSVALLGRVPCRVAGVIQRGDLLCSSSIAGHAVSMPADQYRPGAVIGKALEPHHSAGTGVIEVLVGRL